MLVKQFKRLIAFILPLVTILYLVSTVYNANSEDGLERSLTRRLNDDGKVVVQKPSILPADRLDINDDAVANANYADEEDDVANVNSDELTKSNAHVEVAHDTESEDEGGDYNPLPDGVDYRELFSLSTRDRRYIPIFTGSFRVYNPTVIPHPTQHDLWIVVSQHEQTEPALEFEQLVCNAGILNDFMVCTADPTVLPIEPTISGRCEGDRTYFNLGAGPRDARIFYGPDAPFIAYGSLSTYTCLGIWLQDVRMLLQDFRLEQFTLTKLFEQAAEIQRPPPIKELEKNFFLFWDSEGKAYVHHDIYPHRVFAQLSYDGSVGPDLAPLASSKDNVCMAMYMPTLGPQGESIHQATNSLTITLCKRSDPFCFPTDANTFIMTIFQHKSYHDYHSIYEPYVMLYQRSAPFAIHAISQRPLWIHGRAPLTENTHSPLYENDPSRPIPEGHTEMFYITSMSWKTHGQKYHGYIDDPIYLAFGIEDTRAGLMDVLAEDLVQDLAFCAY